jgi:hypothetical protein
MNDRPRIFRNSRGFWDVRNPPRNYGLSSWGDCWSYPLEWWHKAQRAAHAENHKLLLDRSHGALMEANQTNLEPA